jgi:Fe-S-cluster containining protein
MASRDAERARARAKEMVRERIGVTRDAMAACDDAIDHELEALAARGVTPTCSKGCAHCCRQEISVTRAEAEAIVEWIEAAWPADRRAAFADRVRAWLAWFRGEGRERVAGGMPREIALYEHGPQCVALIDDACTIYPTRPMMCRMHFVRSSPDACRQRSDPALVADRVVVLPSIHRVTQPAVLRIRAEIERQGADFMSTVHLLPEWLAHLLKIEAQPWLNAPPAHA